MKTRLFTLLLLLCLLFTYMLPASAVSLTVGEAVGKTLYKTIITESPLELGRIDQPDPANGLTITAEKTDATTLSIYYEGTPTQTGISYFAVSYVVGGTPIAEYGTLSVKDSSGQGAEYPTTPVISSVSPTSDIRCTTTDSSLFFSVSASGNGSLSYRWLLDGADLNVSGSTLTLTPSTLNAGTYRVYCEVTNSLNRHEQTTDTSWVLTVEEPTAKPVITSKASAAEISGTGSATFSVAAAGKDLHFQWYEQGSSSPLTDGSADTLSISGATTSALKISCKAAPQSITKSYICKVSDSAGNSLTTEAYTLYIKEDATLSTVREITLANPPSKLEYTVGDTLDLTGMTLNAVSGKGSETISTGFACEPMLLQEEGTQTIRVSYQGKTTTFQVTVNARNHEHQFADWVYDAEHHMVTRGCSFEDCTVKEIYSELAFRQEFPEDAEKLGLEASENELPLEEKPEETESSDLEQEPEGEGTKEKKERSASQILLWFCLLAAVLILLTAVLLYIRLYGKKASHKQESHFEDNT